jgi:NADPH2:quinone reductase
VWGQIGHEAKATAVRSQGAAEAVVSGADGLADALRDFAPTVVIDPLGGDFTPAALSVMVVGGRYVLFGTSAGATATLQLQQLYRNGLQVLGYGGLRLTDEQCRSGLTGALAAFGAGQLRIVVDRTLPLVDVNAAIDATRDRAVTGKVMLDLRAGSA